MDKHVVSVCIPVWNSEKTIEDTIKSVLAQTYTDLEIIICDNNSTDSTWAKINTFEDTRIKKYRNDKNIGMVGNWNKCLEYATGDYIHFLCGDDIISSQCIEKKVNLINTNTNITLVFSASEVINENNDIVFVRRFAKRDCIKNGLKLAKKSFLTKNLYGEPSNVLFRKETIAKVGLFSEEIKYSIDWDMWLRLSCMGNVGYINTSLMKYRISKTNGTSKFNIKSFSEDDKIFVKRVKLSGMFKISFFEELYHYFIQRQRMRARILFMRLKCK